LAILNLAELITQDLVPDIAYLYAERGHKSPNQPSELDETGTLLPT